MTPNPSPTVVLLLRAATAELLSKGIDKPNFTVEKVLRLVQTSQILSQMNGRRELFELLIPITDIQLRQLLREIEL